MRVGGSRIVCEPSYVPIENLTFGRLAFKVGPALHVRRVTSAVCRG